jgi:hypothetical protein
VIRDAVDRPAFTVVADARLARLWVEQRADRSPCGRGRFRASEPPIIGRVPGDRSWLDLRGVASAADLLPRLLAGSPPTTGVRERAPRPGAPAREMRRTFGAVHHPVRSHRPLILPVRTRQRA